MSEASTWTWLRDRLPAGHATRIETEVSDGFPDVHYTMRSDEALHPSKSMTLELKFARGPKRQPFRDQVRDSQIRWIGEEIDVGGIVWIVAEMEAKIHFIHGIYAAALNTLPLGVIAQSASLILPRRGSDFVKSRREIYKLFIGEE
jgi:hypothetical protein